MVERARELNLFLPGFTVLFITIATVWIASVVRLQLINLRDQHFIMLS